VRPDTAPWYGHGVSETVLGKALVGVPRRAYYLHTKVGRYQPSPAGMFDFSRERTIASVHESLARLGVEYLDTVQVGRGQRGRSWRLAGWCLNAAAGCPGTQTA
jgi:aryl-alcohol dehydrogenase-like predicted oxidoreductase